MIKQVLPVIFTFTILTGCSILDSGNDEAERTYPEAFDFKNVLLQELLATEPTDSLNVEVYVTKIMLEQDCPNDPLALCFGDGIFISEIKNPADEDIKYPLNMDNPRQFQQGQQYKMSFSIGYIGPDSSKKVSFLGYSTLEKTE